MSEDDKNLPRDEDDPFAEDPFAESEDDSSMNNNEDSQVNHEGDSSSKREEDSSSDRQEDSPERGKDEPGSESQYDSPSDSEEDYYGYDEENPYADSEYDSSAYGEEDSPGEIQDDASLNYGDDSYEYPEDDPSSGGDSDSPVDTQEESSSDTPEPSLAKGGNGSPPHREDDPLADSRMSFGEHLDDLRSRLLKAIYGLLVGFAVCLYFGGDIFAFLAQPLLIALEWSGLEPQLVVMSLPESFITYIKVALFAGLFVSCPWVFYQLWVFIAAGLYPRERKYVHRIIPFSAILFLAGGAFFIFIVAPISCSFFIRFTTNYPMPEIKESKVYQYLGKTFGQDDEGKKNQKEDSGKSDETKISPTIQAFLDLQLKKKYITEEEYNKLIGNERKSEEKGEKKKSFVKPWFTLQKYVSLIMVLGLAFGAAFQMPLVVFFLGRMQFVQLSTFKQNRKFVIFGLVIVAALMTPPDVISQVALVIPMYFLYELGILMVWIWPAKRVE